MELNENYTPGTEVALIYKDIGENKSAGMFGIIFDTETILTDLLLFIDIKTGVLTMRPFRNLMAKVCDKPNEYNDVFLDEELPKINPVEEIMMAPDVDEDVLNEVRKMIDSYHKFESKDKITSKKFLRWSQDYARRTRKNERMVNGKRQLKEENFLETVIKNIDGDTLLFLEELNYSLMLKYPYLHLVSSNAELKTLKTPVTNYLTENFAAKLGKSISQSDAVADMLLSGFGNTSDYPFDYPGQ